MIRGYSGRGVLGSIDVVGTGFNPVGPDRITGSA